MKRFWDRVEKSDSCWRWTGYLTKGYGRIRVDNQHIRAHRLSYQIHFGEIPAGLHVLHHCDNPACVNPDHLYVGTDKDNARDRVVRGRQPRHFGEANPHAKLTAVDVAAIRAGGNVANMAKRYGVSPSTVYMARRGSNWA